MASFRLEPRIKSREEISRLFQHGKPLIEFPVKLLFALNPGATTNTLVFSVPKRKIKSAVKRNLIRRRMKEAYRNNSFLLAECTASDNSRLSLGFVYLTDHPESYELIREKIMLILQRLNKTIAKNQP